MEKAALALPSHGKLTLSQLVHLLISDESQDDCATVKAGHVTLVGHTVVRFTPILHF